MLRAHSVVAVRTDMAPAWTWRLADVDAYRAVRVTHVLGDIDEVLIGARLVGGHEITCAVQIEHELFSEVFDAIFVDGSIDDVISLVETNAGPDVGIADMSLADARDAFGLDAS